MMKVENDLFENLYLKAKLSYNECIMNPDNDYLKNEIDIPIDEIVLMEDFIRVQYFKRDRNAFLVEVKLLLLSRDNSLIGSYLYYENEKKMPVDDILVFD